MQHRAVLLFAVAILALAAAKVLTLDLDAAPVLARGYSDSAHYRDEAAKSFEARNYALFGQWQSHPLDQYRYWRPQSPAWVYSQTLWFRLFGTGLVSARTYALCISLIALVLLANLLYRRAGLWPGLTALLLLGLNFSFFVSSQLALMENLVLLFLIATFVAFERAISSSGPPSLAALVIMTGSFVLCCLSKQSGLLFAPLFLLALLLWTRKAPAGQRRNRFWIAAALACVAGLALLFFVTRPAYLEMLTFNSEHFTERQSVWMNLPTGIPNTLLLIALSLAPILTLLAVIETFHRGYAVGMRRPLGRVLRDALGGDPVFLLALCWILLVLAANFATIHRAVRFHIIILPPITLLAALCIERWIRLRKFRTLLVVSLLFVVYHGMSFVPWLAASERSAVSLPSRLEALIGERPALVAGEYAAQSVMGTRYRNLYVRDDCNADAAILKNVGITHLVSRGRGDPTMRIIERLAPALLTGKRLLGTISFRHRDLQVFELVPALPLSEPQRTE